MKSTPNKSTTLYSNVALIWSWVFLVVGLTFLFFPQQVGQFLTNLANQIGLNGLIYAPGGTLWHVLSLSLMSIITVTARWSAQNPTELTLYRGLMVAKLVSTICFLYLMFFKSSAWLVCAIGDGFVALTLFLSHRGISDLPNGLLPALARKFKNQPRFFEEWFAEFNIEPGKALWIRYTLLHGKSTEASVWAILFEDKVSAFKDMQPLEKLAPGNCHLPLAHENSERFHQPQVYQMGKARLDGENLLGHAGKLSWDLKFTDSNKSFEHVPQSVQSLGISKSIFSSCYLDAKFSGSIKYQDKHYEIKAGRGTIGHIRGLKHAHEWTWCHCNSFAEDDTAVFEGISAKIKLGPFTSPALSSFVVYLKGQRYSFSSVWTMTQAESKFNLASNEPGKWVFKSTRKDVTVEGYAQLPPPDQVAVVEYTDTDDTPMWCHNSQLSKLNLRIVDPKRGIDQKLTTQNTAAFEIAERQKPKAETKIVL